jgi:hypothetical protein
VRPQDKKVHSSYRLRVSATRVAEMNYASGRAELFLNRKCLCKTSQAVRLITDLDGKIRNAIGISAGKMNVILNLASGTKAFSIEPNQSMSIS